MTGEPRFFELISFLYLHWGWDKNLKVTFHQWCQYLIHQSTEPEEKIFKTGTEKFTIFQLMKTEKKILVYCGTKKIQFSHIRSTKG